ATNLPSPLDKKDVIGSIEAWSNISTEWLKFSIDNAFDRINWLNRQRGSNQTSHQGIKLSFVDTLIDKIMNNSPGTALSDIDVVDTTASLIGSSNATLDEVSDNVESEISNITINEAVRLREGLVGSINPSFGPVIGDWSVWTKGRIVIGKTDASTTASKQEIDAQSISLGFDKPVGDDELMGFVLSIGQNNNDIGTASTNVKSDNYSLSNYNVIKLNNNTKIENVFGVGHLEFDTLRTDGSDILTGKRKAKQLFLSTTFKPEDTRYVGNWKVSPYSKVLLANTRLNSFSESGGATALTFNKQEIRDAGLSVGMDINSTVTVNNATINPYAKLEYTRSSSKTSAPMHYNNEDASSYTYTANLNKQIKNWKLKLGADLITESGWNSSVSYTREQPFGSGQASKYSNSFSFNADIQF
ncbi:MAG: autotransporter outer membrane beta-barrel domain-containing protein, partial [Candidatus Pseudothioglobus sp.]